MINGHAGNLPRFRGNACPNWAILVEETNVTLTLHQMTTALDEEPILLKREFPLTSHTYITDIYLFLEENIPEMFVEVIDGLAAGSIFAQEQPSDPILSLRCFPRLPRDGEINWMLSAQELERIVRSNAKPFAGAFSYIGSEKVVICKAHSETSPYPCLGVPGQVAERRLNMCEVAVLAGEGILVIEEVETSSSGYSRATDFIKSTRTRFGMNAAEEILRLSRRVAELEAEIQRIKKNASLKIMVKKLGPG